ncbi:MAG: hypothetical protein KDA89_08500, partial [Planctomycetaceae bacterium]|nr:hypothetical protein [Planctomycetaceae bacterium]
VDEGDTAVNSGSFGDFGDDTVTLTASVGTITAGGDGTWNWSLDTSDGPSDSQTVTITATDSDSAESIAAFQLTVNNAAPVIEFSAAAWSTGEGDGDSRIVTLTRSGDIKAESVVRIVVAVGGTATGGDFAGNSADFRDTLFPLTVTFAPGEAAREIVVPIFDDNVAETDETIFLEVAAQSNAVIGDQNSAILTIVDDDTAVISIVDATVEEGDSGTAIIRFEVTLDGLVDAPVSVDFNTEDLSAGINENGTLIPGSAIGSDRAVVPEDADYVSSLGTLTFTPGSQTQTIEIQVNGDQRVEVAERFLVRLSEIIAGGRDVRFVSGSSASATGTISADDSAVVTIIGGGRVQEGGNLNMQIELLDEDQRGSAVFGEGVQVQFDLGILRDAAGTLPDLADIEQSIADLIQSNPDLSFGSIIFTAPTEGAVLTPLTLALQTIDDLRLEGDETVIVQVSGLTAAQGIATTASATQSRAEFTIEDNDAALWSLIRDGGVEVFEGGAAVFHLSLTDSGGRPTVMGEGQRVSVVPSLDDITTSTTDHVRLADAITAAVGSYSGPGVLSFDGTTLTYTGEHDGDEMESVSVRLFVTDDSLIEGTESFSVTLESSASPTGAVVSIDPDDAPAEVDILDTQGIGGPPDGPGEWSIAGSPSVDEGSRAEYEIVLNGDFGLGLSASVVVGFADGRTADNDLGSATANAVELRDHLSAAAAVSDQLSFDPNTGVLTFTAQSDGDHMEPLRISLTAENDPVPEGPEQFSIILTSPAGSSGISPLLSGTGFVQTTINDTQGPGGPPDENTNDNGITAGFFSGGSSTLPGGDASAADSSAPAFTPTGYYPGNNANSSSASGFGVASDSHSGGLGSGSSDSQNEAAILDLEATLAALLADGQDSVTSDGEEVYFHIVHPDGSLGPKLPLSLEMLENDEIIAVFRRFPNNVYRILYTDGKAGEQQILYELNVEDHRIVPSIPPDADELIAQPDLENDPVVKTPDPPVNVSESHRPSGSDSPPEMSGNAAVPPEESDPSSAASAPNPNADPEVSVRQDLRPGFLNDALSDFDGVRSGRFLRHEAAIISAAALLVPITGGHRSASPRRKDVFLSTGEPNAQNRFTETFAGDPDANTDADANTDTATDTSGRHWNRYLRRLHL